MGCGLLALAGCSGARWHATDVTHASPDLALTMTRASDGKKVTAADFRGKVVLLYLGYTFCPDVCPTTLANLSVVLKKLGSDADRVRVLFVTVDPNRDTAPVLADYVRSFGPQFVGLRGTPDELARLARRYRLEYSVTPKTENHPYEVTHSAAIYAFDARGDARLLISSFGTSKPDIDGVTADLKRLLAQSPSQGFFSRLLRMV